MLTKQHTTSTTAMFMIFFFFIMRLGRSASYEITNPVFGFNIAKLFQSFVDLSQLFFVACWTLLQSSSIGLTREVQEEFRELQSRHRGVHWPQGPRWHCRGWSTAACIWWRSWLHRDKPVLPAGPGSALACMVIIPAAASVARPALQQLSGTPGKSPQNPTALWVQGSLDFKGLKGSWGSSVRRDSESYSVFNLF